MPHFDFIQDQAGRITEIRKDGELYNEDIQLEQIYSVVTTYFKASSTNLEHMKSQCTAETKRIFGLQSFLMALTGLEAFANTYFHLRALQLQSDAMLQRIRQSHGSLSRKIEELLELTPDGPLREQARVIDQIFTLSQLRNDIVHPRWVPVSAAFYSQETVSLTFDGLVENQQRLFEDHAFCREAFLWCLLAVARIGEAGGCRELSGFLFHWTANYQLSLNSILEDLGLPLE